uniref:Uncharacterized protein n=1 Tax=Oryza punctata TaxID=4537 RepID=A0A0E0M1Q6_ORYPU
MARTPSPSLARESAAAAAARRSSADDPAAEAAARVPLVLQLLSSSESETLFNMEFPKRTLEKSAEQINLQRDRQIGGKKLWSMAVQFSFRSVIQTVSIVKTICLKC